MRFGSAKPQTPNPQPEALNCVFPNLLMRLIHGHDDNKNWTMYCSSIIGIDIATPNPGIDDETSKTHKGLPLGSVKDSS